MRLSAAQQQVMQVKLNMLLGADARFPDVRFGELRKDTIEVFVRNGHDVGQIEARHLAVLALVAENTLMRPVHYVNVLAR